MRQTFTAVLTGNPNCGKTTLFNALTGLRAKVGNYAGVTVERKEGALQGAAAGHPVTVLDLPGTYSLSPQSLDERIARDVLFQRLPDVPEPSLVVVVVDASNLQRNLYYATQVIELGYPTFLALNMVDVAQANGHEIDLAALSKALGVPVFPLVASEGQGINELRRAISALAARPGTQHVIPRGFSELPETFGREAQAIGARLQSLFPRRERLAAAEALLLLGDDRVFESHRQLYPADLMAAVGEARARLEAAGVDWRSAAIEARYARVFAIQQHVTTETFTVQESFSDKLDRVLTHRVWGLAIFVAIMAVMFQSIFSFAEWPMKRIEDGVGALAGKVSEMLGPGDFQDLLANGVIEGVGSVVVFLPQICLLFLFIALLEDTGYMSRAAFLMDRLMSRVGLHGKSFIPMLSSFACAIPGIMATRTIESPKDRLVTILVAPLMSCSARLPVYTVLIAACIPNRPLWNFSHEINLGFAKFNLFSFMGLPGLMLLSMYLLGIFGALGMAWLFKKTLLKGKPPPLILELPPYKRPVALVILRHMWDRSKLFLRRAGTVILGINILLWFLVTYPKGTDKDADFAAQRLSAVKSVFPEIGSVAEADAKVDALKQQFGNQPVPPLEETLLQDLGALEKTWSGEQLRHSFAGRLGHLIEPAIQPLGFDWKIGIGIVASFAAREVFVSTMSVVYNVGEVDDSDEGTASLAETMKAERRADGSPVYSTLTGITLMVFYVFAMQCVSTTAVVRRETNGWKWPLFQFAYMTVLAWVLAFVVYQSGKLLGWG
jgi:ferrous iron transport protein B